MEDKPNDRLIRKAPENRKAKSETIHPVPKPSQRADDATAYIGKSYLCPNCGAGLVPVAGVLCIACEQGWTTETLP